MPRFIARLSFFLVLCTLIAPAFPVPVMVQRGLLNGDVGLGSLDAYVVEIVECDDGSTVVGIEFPSPPPNRDLLPFAEVVECTTASGVLLVGVPAFDWCYGCSATAAAMMFGYYDRTGYPNMYTGSANGGVCPTTNATWGYGECPLSATHQGYDGLVLRGHVDDYWSSYGSSVDPYYGNWAEHGYADCTADFMGTGQYQNWQNTDGSTTFFFATGNQPLFDYAGSEDASTPLRDGMHGMHLFAESRGYTVAQNYNQFIWGYGGVSDGFTYEQYCAEIDAGRPVIIQVHGHSMLGIGYDLPNTVYIHDTWDHSMHSMAWGGSYSGMTHFGVGVFHLDPNKAAPQVRTDNAEDVTGVGATLAGAVLDDGGEPCQYRFSYGIYQGGPYEHTDWSGALESGDAFSEFLPGLQKGTIYYFHACAQNSAGTGCGEELTFITIPDGPMTLAAMPHTYLPFYRVELTWEVGEGASYTRVVAGADGYPVDPYDGELIYEGAGSSCTHSGLTPDTTYYYRAWSGVDDGQGGHVWSAAHADADATTAEEPATQEFSVELQPGWNMVSVPLYLPDMSIDSVFEGALAVYEWNTTLNSYRPADELNPMRGYWVVVNDVTSLYWVGVPVSAWTAELEAGWHLVGSVYGGSVDFASPDASPSGSVSAVVNSWDPLSGDYDSLTALESGRGHWVAATEDCILSVDLAG